FPSLIVVLADVLGEFRANTPAIEEAGRPGARVRARIVDGEFDLHDVHFRAREPLDQMQFFSVRRALALHPELFVEADRVDDERVSFPMTHGMPVVTGREILRMRTTIHINHTERLRSGDIEDVDAAEIRIIDDLRPARRDELTRSA